ncbi:NAD(P)H-dependent oxidoreductase [Arthrobacter bambusae]|uniref:NAD(P)H-dependent oxidoreductase n=1 Tax=Arthrobacter bambusae TaxID=1338426 RepID=UPI0027829BC2|nr:NAD(P)H-dependent oxidoreductase [Arthrobacter bambusae]MDQ0030436.1 glutathione-regulated potassium-efflux system ancillary protein KefG [Arthrobacter bambusae]MDQ0098353.1 glutathione-regulated potassium-efflux system ancillary protein KefG [Arthrobacter bambusae]
MTAPRTLVIVAHPDLNTSRITAQLAGALTDLDGVTVRDLGSIYPDRRFDAAREQQLLREHDMIVLQFPWHWYSVPGVLKEWMNQVLTYGFAYGAGGDALHGKRLQLVISTGGPELSYTATGHNRFTMAELLRPLEASAHLCGLEMAEPLILHAAPRVSHDELAAHAVRYRKLLSAVPAGASRA